jgi:hypothetical protein
VQSNQYQSMRKQNENKKKGRPSQCQAKTLLHPTRENTSRRAGCCDTSGSAGPLNCRSARNADRLGSYSSRMTVAGTLRRPG